MFSELTQKPLILVVDQICLAEEEMHQYTNKIMCLEKKSEYTSRGKQFIT